MNNIDRQYKELIEHILHFGIDKKDRTGTGTKSAFGWQIRHRMSDGFPLLTTKKMYFKGIATELLWFLRGDTNIKYLVDNDCHIWDGDAYKNYLTMWSERIPASKGMGSELKTSYEERERWGKIITISKDDQGIGGVTSEDAPFSKEEFINKIKTDDEFAKKWGELGPIYGSQWRSWKFTDKFTNGEQIAYVNGKVDQIANLINELKTNPDSRRLMVNAWNVGELDQIVLPPCHYGFQVYTRDLRLIERIDIAIKKGLTTKNAHLSEEDYWKWCDEKNIPTRAISLMWNQRSVDVPLGLPFNIASYGLLLEIIAKEVNMVPEDLIGNLGDCHIYNNQIEGVKEQLTRQPFELPTLIFEKEIIFNIFSIEQSGRNNFNVVSPDDFQIENYQSHPAIKIPLNN